MSSHTLSPFRFQGAFKGAFTALGAASVFWCTSAMAATFGHPVVARSASQQGLTVVESGSVPPQPVIVKTPSAVSVTQAALAQITASDAAGAQIVTLSYSPHETFNVPLRQGLFTTFAIPTDEPIQQFAVSNPAAVELKVSPATNTAMVKLMQPITVVGTIVTKKHIFYINIVPALGTAPWYQGVNWSFDTQTFGTSSFGEGIYTSPGATDTTSGTATSADPSDALFTGEPNFNYSIKGTAEFKPQAIWDNGRFTWVQLAKNVQELPALFIDGPNGLEIVNYTVHAGGTQLLVNRLMPKFVLKLGKSEIHVTADH